ncbi:MAG: tetratricopeptide repeat protein [Gemmatimonadetes bacterium]|nr:tetratricopeptide repeat protein [Gemmatimonadota bacterium]
MKFRRLEICNGMAALILLWTAAGCASTPRPDSHDADIGGAMEAGNASMRNGDYAGAISFYRRALAIDMTDSEAFGNLGVAYYYLERYDDAVREALQAVVLSPEEINWRLNLGAIYTRRDDHEGAARAYGAAVDIARDLPDENRHQLRNALLGLGRSCEMAGWYDRALEAYKEALVFAPEDTELLTGAGNVYFRLGRLDEAEASYQRTLARDSTHTVARYNVALIYARTGRYEEALELFEDNPAVDRQLEGALEGSTVIAVDRSKTRSITAYRAMLERMGGTPPPVARQGRRASRPLPYIHVMGVTYYEQGAYFEAMQAFEKALEEDPGLADAHLYIGNIHARQNRHAAAIDAYEKAVDADAEFAEAYNNLGSMYANLDRTEDAMAAYRKALSLNDRFYDARTNLGLLYAEAGRLDDAVDEYMKVIRADVGIAEVHNNLGMVYLRQGRNDDAREQFEKAIALHAGFAEAYNNLALTYSRNIVLDDVIETWRELAAGWAGHNRTTGTVYDWLPLRRVPARSSAVGGEARSAYRDGVDAAFAHDLDTAISRFEEALAMRPGWGAARIAIGAVLLAQGKWDAVESAVAEALDPESSDPLPNAIMAIAQVSGGDYGSALMSWEESVRFAAEPDRTDAREALEAMRSRTEAGESVLNALDRALALRPGFATAHFNIGLVNDQLHRYHQGIRSYREVVRLAPELAAGHFRLGIAYYRLGEFEKARDSMREYIRLSADPMLLPQVETFLNKQG